MSVKFQEETVRTVTGGKPEDLAHRVGERLTGGKTQTGYLQVCICQKGRSRDRNRLLAEHCSNR
jgi:hypothetical protein